MHPLVRRSKRLAKLLKRFAYFFFPPVLYAPHKGLLPRVLQKKTRQQLARAIERRFGASAGLDAEASQLYAKGGGIADFCEKTFWLHENTPTEVRIKADRCREVLGQRIDRVRLYREIARLERSIGNDLIAAVYAIRSMRLLGDDRFGDLGWALPTLNRHGYGHEARVADAMFGPHSDRRARCRQLLGAAYERCRTLPPPCEFAVYEERRGDCTPRVSVIVSLYNAAGKIRLFIDLLRRQTLLLAGQIELIFVDSASPANEQEAIRSSDVARDLPYLFVRTPERESIQTAWNRGIALARAPYLAFLGVDETVMPTAYEELAAELDAYADIDWVMADSLVTEVDARGNPVRDAMPYDREGYTQDHVYLETCYLSWVGALYRRSIHERYGYYDGSFRAAGDTEFKGRVLPYIRSKRVPRMLGVFLNYPEERTTASPRAELEDLRAWYLHRSPGGIDYAFGKRSPADLEAMISRALGYRKSYCRHWSSDVDYASAALEVLREAAPASPILALDESVNRLVNAFRVLDCLPNTSAIDNENSILSVHQATVALNACARTLPAPPPEKQTIFQDNRYEQHVHPW
jgi:glycosyltransferase involved in cell wall biosynthesis